MAYKTKTNYSCKNLENYNNRRKRKVAQILDGQIIKIFDSLSSVADDGFDFSLVRKVARGERSHHKNYQWRFI